MTLTVVPTPTSIVAPQLEITGGRRLSGEVRVSGAKNSALVLMAACLLSRDTLRLTNVPLTDIAGMGEILTALGVRVRRGQDWVELDASHLSQSTPPTSW